MPPIRVRAATAEASVAAAAAVADAATEEAMAGAMVVTVAPNEAQNVVPTAAQDRTPDRSADRTFASDRRIARALRSLLASRRADPLHGFRSMDSSRVQPSGPPPGYQPIILPGESISKYQRYAQQPPAPEPPTRQAASQAFHEATPAEPEAPVAAAFPEDEPIFADASAQSAAEPLHEQHDDAPQDIRAIHESHIEEESTENEQIEEEEVEQDRLLDRVEGETEPIQSASTSANWNQEFRLRGSLHLLPSLGWPGETSVAVDEIALEHEKEEAVAEK